jgi:hypothetical protein
LLSTLLQCLLDRFFTFEFWVSSSSTAMVQISVNVIGFFYGFSQEIVGSLETKMNGSCGMIAR